MQRIIERLVQSRDIPIPDVTLLGVTFGLSSCAVV